MRSLVCLLATVGLGACVPDDVDFDHPTQPTSGRAIGGVGEGSGDNDNGGGGGTNPPLPDAGTTVITDGGVFDAGPFLDAFDVPQDAPEPPDQTDQIP